MSDFFNGRDRYRLSCEHIYSVSLALICGLSGLAKWSMSVVPTSENRPYKGSQIKYDDRNLEYISLIMIK